ncbi:MAG: hypothetical protein K2Z81_07120 [Cyanobacteria bacterium]|nr:hypothetical protein [Cyanobacteriota bacterium]
MFSRQEFNPLKFISSLLDRVGKKTVVKTVEEPKEEEDIVLENNPWQTDLDHLAKKFGEPETKLNQSRNRIRSMAGTEAEEQFVELCKTVETGKQVETSLKDKLVPHGTEPKRNGDCTNHDLMAWWGESVATWDPLNAKNVDSDRQGRQRKDTWLDRRVERPDLKS